MKTIIFNESTLTGKSYVVPVIGVADVRPEHSFLMNYLNQADKINYAILAYLDENTGFIAFVAVASLSEFEITVVNTDLSEEKATFLATNINAALVDAMIAYPNAEGFLF